MTETITIHKSSNRYFLLEDVDGNFCSAEGLCSYLGLSDSALWISQGERFINALDNSVVLEKANFQVIPGPSRLLTELAEEFSTQGWVCLPGILSAETVQELAAVAGTAIGVKFGGLTERGAVARAVAEPISLWLCRYYLGTPQIKIAHPPSIAVVAKDDGEMDVQGWHCDYPYLWGITDSVPQAASDIVLGVQRNVCITDFSRTNGATLFVLGSHLRNCAPPKEWGLQSDYGASGYRANVGLPYSGLDTHVIEAPAGSILLYDARTWHRQGVSAVDTPRAAMLQAMTPDYVTPFYDTSVEYRAMCESTFYGDLSVREQTELAHLLVHTTGTAFGSSR